MLAKNTNLLRFYDDFLFFYCIVLRKSLQFTQNFAQNTIYTKQAQKQKYLTKTTQINTEAMLKKGCKC